MAYEQNLIREEEEKEAKSKHQMLTEELERKLAKLEHALSEERKIW